MIRLAYIDDIQALSDFSCTWDEDDPEPLNDELIANYIADGSLYCAEEDDEIVGAMILIDNGARRVQLSRLFVHEDYRGDGIGSAFMGQLTEHMDRQGLKTAFVTVSLNNDDAMSFYERHGFQDTGSRTEGRYGETYCDMGLER